MDRAPCPRRQNSGAADPRCPHRRLLHQPRSLGTVDRRPRLLPFPRTQNPQSAAGVMREIVHPSSFDRLRALVAVVKKTVRYQFKEQLGRAAHPGTQVSRLAAAAPPNPPCAKSSSSLIPHPSSFKCHAVVPQGEGGSFKKASPLGRNARYKLMYYSVLLHTSLKTDDYF